MLILVLLWILLLPFPKPCMPQLHHFKNNWQFFFYSSTITLLKIDFFKKIGLYRIALTKLCLKVRIITPEVIMQRHLVPGSMLFAACSWGAQSQHPTREITVWSENDDHFKIMTFENWESDESYLWYFQRAKAKIVASLEHLCFYQTINDCLNFSNLFSIFKVSHLNFLLFIHLFIINFIVLKLAHGIRSISTCIIFYFQMYVLFLNLRYSCITPSSHSSFQPFHVFPNPSQINSVFSVIVSVVIFTHICINI